MHSLQYQDKHKRTKSPVMLFFLKHKTFRVVNAEITVHVLNVNNQKLKETRLRCAHVMTNSKMDD